MKIDTTVHCILVLVLLTLTLIQGHTIARKQILLHQLSLSKFSIDLNAMCVLLSPVGVMNLILILSRPFSIQGREPNLNDFIEKLWGWLIFRHLYKTNFFQTWCDVRDH